MSNERPNPDQLLKKVQAEEEAVGRGRLKLYFGASPGVGKTYAMLEAARQRKKEGGDVVAGIVETHGRSETEALLQDLEILPRKEVPYKGVTLHEFDLDAALSRRPRLLLMDELAHTNAPGLRHSKRWQDLEELLDAGIDIYTTLNVQHWESLNDLVAQITGVVVRETVPDTFLRRAHELELVDLPPEDLLKRLEAGKVYRGEIAGRAAENFFKPGNLIALRELALRHTAERVDAQMQAFKERNSIEEAWSIGERLLVGVTASPMSARLIRAASRLAGRLHAPWIAVHVETPAFHRSSAEDRGRVIENLRVAEKLGAEAVTLVGENVTNEIIALARERNVTRIVLGKPARPRWREWISGSVVNEIARKGGNIDLHVISGVGSDVGRRRPPIEEKSSGWGGVSWAAGIVALSTLICWPLLHFLDRVNLVMIYLLGVVVTAYYFGRRASIFATVLSVLCFDFFFVPPYLTFAASDTQYFVTFGIMLGVGILISTIMGRLRLQTLTLRKRESRMRSLYKLSRTLSETPETDRMLLTAVEQLEEFYKCPALLLTQDTQGGLEISAGDPKSFGWNENELSVARWVFDKSQPAGAGSDTLAGAAGLHVPLKGIRSTMGVLAIRPENPKAIQDPEQLQLLESFAGEIGGALESTRMSEAMGRAELQMEMQALNQIGSASRPKISDFVTLNRIRILPAGFSKEQIIRDLLSTLNVSNPNQAFQAVLEREKTGPTLIGPGVAAPHARLNGLKSLEASLGVSREGPVRIWVLFLAPEKNYQLHLSFLAGVSAFFLNEPHIDALASMKSEKDILAYLHSQEKLMPA